ncbi:MAG: FAD-dependent oxidoreductase [Burkholderiales bacterium]|nr:FAD-dependent oxidoreductase [Burkholderiales bacterium]
MATALTALFAPGTIGKMALANRLIMAPMGTNYSTWNGIVTDRLVDYYAERARGGVSLVTVGFSHVHPTGQTSPYSMGVHDDALIPGLRRLTDAIHAGGAKASIQIAHGGRRCSSAITGAQLLAPSALSCVGGEMPRELSLEEIQTVIAWFVHAARRVREAGYDAVTLHLANGYLLQSFLSPYSNRRSDLYGGSVEARARLPMEIVEGMRRELGSEMPIIVRLSVDDFLEGGATLTEGRRTAQLLESAGADAIDVTAGLPETMYIIGPPMAMPKGFLVSHARAIKDSVRIPVAVVGRINDPVLAEQILREGHADFIALGRPLLADPDFANKARDGRLEDICPCIACNEGCFQRLYSQLDVSCVVNPRVGREAMFPDAPAPRAKQVLVVGGGPGGMMAALTAAARGHRVVLCERGPRLGGQLLMGDVPPHKEEIRALREYLVGQIAKSGVETRLDTTVTRELVESIGAEAVIVATGARPLACTVPAIDACIVSAWDLLSGRATAGAMTLVIGGGEVGCELAEYLAAQGREVVIVELLSSVLNGTEPRARTLLLRRLRELGVQVLTQSRVIEVRVAVVTYERAGLKHRIQGIDTVVAALGSAAESELGDALAESAGVQVIGDCVKPRRILEAIREGYDTAYAL